MNTKDYDFSYEMEDFWGDTVTIYGNEGGPAYIDLPEYFGGETREFPSAEAAYNWAYKRGYRD